jgi:NADH-quinone oxidoreductase subunit M
MQQDNAVGRMVLTVVAASGMILGAWYLFTMTRRLLFGAVKEPATGDHHVGDLKPREWLLLAPLLALCVLIGVWPQPILDTARPDVETVAYIAQQARDRQHLTSTGSPAAAARAEAP